ncbi:hypothetical protein BST81_23130, partial [Leptolyngbya sp. 'hensonii']
RLRQQAERLGVQMSLLEELNGIDLANQSPRAALSRGGYVERLQEAHQQGLQGMDAVIWARTRSFLNPDTGQWNAPGLGNREDSIKADQGRRFREIAQTVAKHQQQQGLIATQPSISPTQMLADVAQAQPLAIPQSELITPQKPPPLPGRETPERLEGLPSVHASSQTAGLGAREVQSSIEAASPKVRSSKNRLAENLPAGNETAGMTVVGRGSIPTWGALPGKIPIEAMTGKVHRFMRTLAVEQSPPGSTRREQILRLQRLSSTVHPTLESEPAQSDRISQSISPQSISPSTVQRDQIETAPVAPETAEENTGLLVETASSGPPRSGLSAATIEHEPKPSAASDQATPSLREDVAEQIIFQDLPTVAPEN